MTPETSNLAPNLKTVLPNAPTKIRIGAAVCALFPFFLGWQRILKLWQDQTKPHIQVEESWIQILFRDYNTILLNNEASNHAGIPGQIAKYSHPGTIQQNFKVSCLSTSHEYKVA